jgi:hypothetical protein
MNCVADELEASVSATKECRGDTKIIGGDLNVSVDDRE